MCKGAEVQSRCRGSAEVIVQVIVQQSRCKVQRFRGGAEQQVQRCRCRGEGAGDGAGAGAEMQI